MKNTEYRNCFERGEEFCVFANFNGHKVECCTIDRITHIEWFGCVPQEAIDKLSEKLEKEE